MNGPTVQSPVSLARDCALAGDALFLAGKFPEALEQFKQAVLLQPLEPVYHFRLASAAWKIERGDLVEHHYGEAIRLDPTLAEAHLRLAQWFHRQQDMPQALHHSAAALALEPKDAETIITRATVLIAAGQTGPAYDLLRPLITAEANDQHLASAYAELAPKLGHRPQALALVERALANPALAPDGKSHLHFAAANLLDGLGRYDDAFSHARIANELARRPFDPAAYSAWVSSTIAYFTEDRLRALPRATYGDRRPIFIVGMPRSGTSLVEQILATHPAVHGAGELKLLHRISQSILGGKPWESALADFSEAEADRFAREYVSGIESFITVGGSPGVRPGLPPTAMTSDQSNHDGPRVKAAVGSSHRAAHAVAHASRLGPDSQEIKTGTPVSRSLHAPELTTLDGLAATRITDKMPGNFEVLWLIESLLPASRIIHVTRDPRDTCLSCYFTDFAEANAFSFDLDHLACYYGDYRRLMEHWKRVISVPILDVRYEELVADPNGQTRRLLEFLGLPWDDRCLRFHQNPRHVATTSRDQVRRPMYGSSVGRWKNYAKHLSAVMELACDTR